MTLAEFRASRVSLTLAQCEAAGFTFADDLDLDESYIGAYIYSGGCFILQKRHCLHLLVESDEYESRDLALLEFVLWQWSVDTKEAETARRMIWG